MIAVNCGTPTPATIRVVQIEPGPMPILIGDRPLIMVCSCEPVVSAPMAFTVGALHRSDGSRAAWSITGSLAGC